ncbi:MAG: orotate phosphoribosyltransferase [Coxiella sp. RIFCSPHIGHO2_12_FULL_42_15]|nr:MAG: orotate phosphoribosyltransferase [Coxiella sp. RIFCSPHIGHO2_12_FULL_42_15]
MLSYKKKFIQLCLQCNVLRFGEFTLKSGRKSPYFFNAGLFQTGAALAKVGGFYTQAIQAANLRFDLLFGPAYKGIPLVSTVAIALADHHRLDKPYAFNRKEAKDHGEGGSLIGAPLVGKVLIVDDVITAGTAVRESIHLITKAGAQLAGVLVLLDRQERGQHQLSAIQEIEQRYQIPVVSIIQLQDIVAFVADDPATHEHFAQIEQYRAQYGIADMG